MKRFGKILPAERITIVYRLHNPYKMLWKRAGVYRIVFDTRFYVGSTSNVYNRMRLHQSDINSYFDHRNKLPEPGSWQDHVVEHLKKNEGIRTALAEILEVCEPNRMFELEQKWLKKFEGDPNCLNSRYYTIFKEPKNEIRIGDNTSTQSECDPGTT